MLYARNSLEGIEILLEGVDKIDWERGINQDGSLSYHLPARKTKLYFNAVVTSQTWYSWKFRPPIECSLIFWNVTMKGKDE